MLNYKSIFFICAYFSFISFSNAQINPGFSINGIVVDSNKNALEGATIILLRGRDSSVVKIALTDKKGLFEFPNLSNDSYLLSVSFVGFKKQLTQPYAFFESKPTQDIGVITLLASDNALNEITVTAAKKLLDVHPGKVILNIENSIIATGSSALELLKRAPGVQVDNNYNIRLNGKQGVLITIDGKQTYMDNDALGELLHNTRSESIESIELISNPSAKYTAEGSGAIINIKTKKNKSLGANGSMNIGFGNSDLGSGFNPNQRYNGGINANYRTQKLNIFGSNNYADQTFYRTSLLDRNINNNNQVTNIKVDYLSKQQRKSDTYRIGTDYFISPKQTIGFLVAGNYSKLNIAKQNRSDISDGNSNSSIETKSDQNRKFSNIGFNLNYKGKLGKKESELSIDLDYFIYDRSSLEFLTNNYSNGTDKFFSNSSPSDYDIKSLKIDYILPIKKDQSLSIGIQSSNVSGNSKLDFGEIVSGAYQPDAMLTGQFKVNNQINAAYVSYKRDFKKSVLELGLRAEQTFPEEDPLPGSSTKLGYFNLFPNLQFTQNLNQNNQLLFSYSRRILRPPYEDLNPFVGYLDQYTYHYGNPLLKPSYTQNVELTHVYKEKYTTTIRASLTNDVFLNVLEQDNVTMVNKSIRRNLDKQFTYGISFNAPLTVYKNWSMDNTIEAFYQRFTNKSIAGNLDNGSPDVTFTTLQSFTFPHVFNAELSAKYETPTSYGISKYKSLYSMDFGISRSFWDKKANLKFKVSDIFNTDKDRFSSNYQNLDLRGVEKTESRIAQLSFTYLFGKKTVKAARKRSTGSESEQERLKTSG